MSWRNIQNPESIRKAIDECDRLGRDVFLEKYGYGRATKYALVANGKHYDTKAILGVAYKHESGNLALRPHQVKNRKDRQKKLEELGFKVIKFK